MLSGVLSPRREIFRPSEEVFSPRREYFRSGEGYFRPGEIGLAQAKKKKFFFFRLFVSECLALLECNVCI